ncbi:MAG: hypothetical protein H7329_11540 [Opitutaceae bacterium]|nr:hypothetical protein [Cytophagales bacterium]
MRIIIFNLLGILFFISCKQIDNSKPAGSFVRYLNRSTWDSIYIDNYLRPAQSYLNLREIENGVDSFEVRMFIGQAFSSIDQLYLIKATKDSLEKKHYYFEPQFPNNPNGSIADAKKQFALMHNFFFKKTDTAFLNLFQKSHIDTLPTQRLIPNLKGGCTDGASYIVEIATKNSYRLIIYFNPDCYPDSKQNQQFDNFINNFKSLLPENEFNWYYQNDNLKLLLSK